MGSDARTYSPSPAGSVRFASISIAPPSHPSLTPLPPLAHSTLTRAPRPARYPAFLIVIFSLSLKGAFPGLALGSSDVPKIIHQSWKTTQLREDHEVWQQSWFDANPDWKYMFWTDLDNRQLVADFYPDLLYTYDILPKNISRADFVRALYMHKYGGVYADLDTWCLRPVDTLLTAGPGIAYVAEMGPDLTYAHNIPNAWYASSPGHPFWLFFVERVVELTQNVVDGRRGWPDIEEIAGPVMLKAALDVGIWTRSDARSLTRSLAHSLTRSFSPSPVMERRPFVHRPGPQGGNDQARPGLRARLACQRRFDPLEDVCHRQEQTTQGRMPRRGSAHGSGAASVQRGLPRRGRPHLLVAHVVVVAGGRWQVAGILSTSIMFQVYSHFCWPIMACICCSASAESSPNRWPTRALPFMYLLQQFWTHRSSVVSRSLLLKPWTHSLKHFSTNVLYIRSESRTWSVSVKRA